MITRDQLMGLGCGTEIAEDAESRGYKPELLGDNGQSGDQRLTLWACGETRAINTNGGAVWEEAAKEAFDELLEQITVRYV